MLLRAKWRPHYGVLPSGLNLSYYAVYCRKGSTLGSHPKPQSMFKVLPRPPANYPSYSVSVPKIIQFVTFFFKQPGHFPKYLTISYLSPSIQVIVCLRWVHFGQKEASLKKKKKKDLKIKVALILVYQGENVLHFFCQIFFTAQESSSLA